MIKLSIASYSFHGLFHEGKMNVFTYLDALKHHFGIQAADLWNGSLESYDRDYLKKIREAMDEKEMVLANFAVDGAHIWETDPDIRSWNYRYAVKSLETAVLLGAQTVRIDLGSGDPRHQCGIWHPHPDLFERNRKASSLPNDHPSWNYCRFSQEQLEHIVKRCREYASIASEYGIKIGPENHWGPERVVSNMKEVIEAVNSPSFGMLLHIGNWVGKGSAEGDSIMAPLAFHTHFSAGITGRLLEERVRMMVNAGYQGYWGVEHHSGIDEWTRTENQMGCLIKAYQLLMG